MVRQLVKNLILYNGTQAVSRMERINSIIRLFHTIKHVRDKVIDWQFTRHVLLDQFRNIGTALVATKGRSFLNTSRDELKGTRRNLVTRRGYSNHTRRAPTTVGTFQGRAHDLNVPRAVERIIDSPLGQVTSNVLLDRFVECFAIDAIRRSEPFGHLELLWVDVDRNNLACSRHFSALNHG